MNETRNFFKRVRIDTILRAIFLMVMGILFLIDPVDAAVSFTLLLSILILCDGVVSFALYFCTDGLFGFFGTALLGSVFKITYGILALSNPTASATFFSLMFAIYIIVVSTNTIEESMYLRRSGYHWVCPLILGIISLSGGVTMLFMVPGTLVEATGIVAGITLIISSIEDIVLVIDMYKTKKRLKSYASDDNVIDVEVKEIK